MEINKVFIAENEAIIALDIKSILAANSFSVIGTCRTYNGVVRIVKEQSPDLLITSLHINKEHDYFDKIVSLQKEYNFFVLFLSAIVDVSKFKAKCNSEHFTFLKKPFNSDDLLKSINTLKLKTNI